MVKRDLHTESCCTLLKMRWLEASRAWTHEAGLVLTVATLTCSQSVIELLDGKLDGEGDSVLSQADRLDKNRHS